MDGSLPLELMLLRILSGLISDPLRYKHFEGVEITISDLGSESNIARTWKILFSYFLCSLKVIQKQKYTFIKDGSEF